MLNFIPKQYKKDPVTIRIPTEKLKEIDRLAARLHMSRSELVNQCIAYAMRHNAEESQEEPPG